MVLALGARALPALAAGGLISGCHRHATAPAAKAPTIASPVVRGAGSGLEIWSWAVVDKPEERIPPPSPDGRPSKPRTVHIVDPRPTLEEILGPYLERPVPMDPAVRDHWRANGLRIVSIPAADVERIQDHMRITGQAQRQWLGELTQWTDIIHGPVLDEPRSVATEQGLLVLDPGRLTLMARCWETPGLDEGSAALRLEIIPEHLRTIDTGERWRAAAGLDADEPAVRFDILATGMVLSSAESAFVIVADTPAADWTAGPSAAPSEDDAAAAGPAPLPAPTIGELMLANPAARGQPRTRAVIVLVPRMSDRFHLLP